MFNKTPPRAPSIPPLPDLPSPGRSATAPHGAAPTAAPQPTISSRGLSTLSAELQFEGNVSGGGDLQIDGAIKGDVKVGRLIVGETGSVDGNVSADYLEVRGRIVGGVSGRQVKLISTAYVDGDVTAEQLSIDVGAFFQGRVLQSRREAPVAAPQSAPVQPAPIQAPPPRPVEPAPQTITMSSPKPE